MDLISLLVTVLLVGLILWLATWIIGQIPMPAPFKTVALVIVGVIGLLILLSMLLGGLPLPRLRLG